MMKVFAAFCLILALPILSQAQTSVIPYSGQLEAGGVHVSDDVQMRFRLFNANPDGADPAPAPMWSSAADGAWNTVKVFQGKFHVNLGGEGFRQGALGIPDSVFDGEQIWMRIEIDNGNNADHVLPSQALHTVPRAVSAKRATNFTVTQTLTAQDVTANGTLTVNGAGPHIIGSLELGDGQATINGNVRISGNVTTAGEAAYSGTIRFPYGTVNSRGGERLRDRVCNDTLYGTVYVMGSGPVGGFNSLAESLYAGLWICIEHRGSPRWLHIMDQTDRQNNTPTVRLVNGSP